MVSMMFSGWKKQTYKKNEQPEKGCKNEHLDCVYETQLKINQLWYVR